MLGSDGEMCETDGGVFCGGRTSVKRDWGNEDCLCMGRGGSWVGR